MLVTVLLATAACSDDDSSPPPSLPTFSSGASASTEENVTTQVVYTAVAQAVGVVSYAITGGADAASFVIDAASGDVRFASPPDFEAPSDADANNVYEITITASTSGVSSARNVSITVNNVIESAFLETTGIRFDGMATSIAGTQRSDLAGTSIAAIGDINADGFGEILIGAPANDDETGAAYVVFGSTTTGVVEGTVDLDSLALGGEIITLVGNEAESLANLGSQFGTAVAGGGDVNADGIADVIIGAPGQDLDPLTQDSGAVFIFYGDDLTTDLDGMLTSGVDGVQLGGDPAISSTKLGVAVAFVSDLNADGNDELLIADENDAFLVFGDALPVAAGAATDLPTLIAAGAVVRFDRTGVGSGVTSIASAGDVDGDGLDDVLIGVAGADASGAVDSGQTFLVLGSAIVADADRVIELATIDTAGVGVRFDGFLVNGLSGISVAGAGDIDGDGENEILIGAPGLRGGPFIAGQAYVIFSGAVQAELASGDGIIALDEIDTLAQGIVIEGFDGGGNGGAPVVGAGDVDGDGVTDVLIAAPFAEVGGIANVGETFLLSGADLMAAPARRFDVGAVGILNNDSVRIEGENEDDFAGSALSSADDINNDGNADILIGAPSFAAGFPATRGGAVYAVSGETVRDEAENQDGVIMLSDVNP